MPDDSNGNYTVPSGTLVNTGDTVLPSQHNPWANDSASAISNRFSKDGRAPATGNWNLNSFRITQLGAPSATTDATTKAYVDSAITAVNSSQPKIENLAADRLVLAADKGTSFRFSGNRTLTFQPAATLGANWWCEAWSKSGIVTLDPDASETIEGSTTMLLQTGERCIIFCTGTLFYAITASSSYSGPQLQGYYFGLGLSTNATDAANDIDIAVGSAAADVSPYDLMQLTSARTKRIDAAWAVGNNAGGLDTGSVGNNTYYIWLIRRPDTGIVDALFSLSSTAPTMPTNYTQKRLIGSLIRASATNGAPSSSLSGASGIQLGTMVTPTVAAVDKTGIPANAKRITVNFDNLSTNGTGIVMVQLGTSGGVSTTGYIGAVSNSAGAAANLSSGFFIEPSGTAATVRHGAVVLTLVGSNTWVAQIVGGYSNTTATFFGGGSKALSGVLDRVRLTTVGGTDVFDLGDVNFSYEV